MSVSGPAWTLNWSRWAATTVRQQPLTATLSPSASGSTRSGQTRANRRPDASSSAASTVPNASTNPVNMPPRPKSSAADKEEASILTDPVGWLRRPARFC